VLAERPVIVFGKWRGEPKGTIKVTGIGGGGPFTQTVEAGRSLPSDADKALRHLWARHRIALLSAYNALKMNDGRTKEVTDLGLTYNLLTAYTSFVAVDTEARNKEGGSTTITQPLPLPEGVSNYAVGGMRLYGKAPAAHLPAKRKLAAEGDESPANPAEQAPTIRIAALKVSDERERAVIEKAIQSHLGKLAQCFGNGRGKVALVFSITSQGKVAKAVLDRDKTGSAQVGRCILKQVRKWNFDRKAGGKDMKVTVEIVL